MASAPQRPRLLVLGSGFASYAVARAAKPGLYDVTVVSKRNHFVYTPLLPSTAVGTSSGSARSRAHCSGLVSST